MTTTLLAPRPQFTAEDLGSRNHWILDEIYDLNADALDGTCLECDAALSWGQWLKANEFMADVHCHSCGARIRAAGSHQNLPLRQLREVAMPGYFEQRWFHATRLKNWSDVVGEALGGDLIVHAGSRLSALSRADALRSLGDIYLHSFTLSSTAGFSPVIFDDMAEDWPETLEESEEYSMRVCRVEGEDEDKPSRWQPLGFGYDGAAYYNRYEVPGDISILFHAQLIDSYSVETVLLDRAPEPAAEWKIIPGDS